MTLEELNTFLEEHNFEESATPREGNKRWYKIYQGSADRRVVFELDQHGMLRSMLEKQVDGTYRVIQVTTRQHLLEDIIIDDNQTLVMDLAPSNVFVELHLSVWTLDQFEGG